MQNFEVTRNKDNLHRERWIFLLDVGIGSYDRIFFEGYYIEHKDNAASIGGQFKITET